MGASFKIMTIRGIGIKIHATFFLILVYAAFAFGGRGRLDAALFGVAATLLLFACVLLHELGHSIVAQRYGIRVRDITLWPIGGVARLERMPDRPSQEFWVAIAGPAVNFAIAGLIFAAMWIVTSPAGLSLRAFERGLVRYEAIGLVPYLLSANLFLGLFNLIPAFPMDGGRILRAALAARLGSLRATSIAVGVGQSLAVVAGLLGLMTGQLNLVLIAVFVYFGAGSEGHLTQVKSQLDDLRVRQAIMRRVEVLSPDDRLSRAVDLTLSTFQTDFPVLRDGELIGLLARSDLLAAMQERGPMAFVVSVMRRSFPAVAPDDSLFTAQQLMREHELEALPVLDGDRFGGLVTRRTVEEVVRLRRTYPQLFRARDAAADGPIV